MPFLLQMRIVVSQDICWSVWGGAGDGLAVQYVTWNIVLFVTAILFCFVILATQVILESIEDWIGKRFYFPAPYLLLRPCLFTLTPPTRPNILLPLLICPRWARGFTRIFEAKRSAKQLRSDVINAFSLLFLHFLLAKWFEKKRKTATVVIC